MSDREYAILQEARMAGYRYQAGKSKTRYSETRFWLIVAALLGSALVFGFLL